MTSLAPHLEKTIHKTSVTCVDLWMKMNAFLNHVVHCKTQQNHNLVQIHHLFPYEYLLFHYKMEHSIFLLFGLSGFLKNKLYDSMFFAAISDLTKVYIFLNTLQ